MKRTQSGMTLIAFIIVLGVVGLFAYVGMKLIPMYSEYYAVKQALKGLQ
jgi:type II secretory pathway pseudopilin PulG